MVVLYLIFLIQGQENIEANAKEEEGKLGEEKATSGKHHQEMYICVDASERTVPVPA